MAFSVFKYTALFPSVLFEQYFSFLNRKFQENVGIVFNASIYFSAPTALSFNTQDSYESVLFIEAVE